MKQLIYSTCVFTALAVFSTPAFAVDGVTLINQATVQAAGGFPYVISQTGSYRLSGNLVAANTIAINITAPNVTLDLNGFTVSCGNCGGIPQQLVGGINGNATGSVILNGAVTGFSATNCIYLGANARVEHVSVSQCGEDGIGGSGDLQVLNSTVTSAGADGIGAGGDHLVVANTVIDGFGNDGIEAGTLNISGSTIVSTVAFTVGILSSSGVISGNTISVPGIGIRVVTGAVASITNNVISGAVTGVLAPGTALVGSNTFSGNQHDLVGTGFVSQKNNACSNGSGC